MQRECDNCGGSFEVPKGSKFHLCISCARAAKANPPKQHMSELDRFMAQPEIAQLRAGIQTAIRTAWTRCFGD